MATTQVAILQTQQDIQQAQADIAAQQAALDARARMAYEQGPGSTIELVLGSTSAADLNDRLEILNAAAQSDQDLINVLTDQTNRLQVQQNQLTEQKSQLQHQQGDLQAQQDALDAKFQAEQDVVQNVARFCRELPSSANSSWTNRNAARAGMEPSGMR